MSRARAALVANAIAFQACWLAFVAGAGAGISWPGFVLLALFAALQLRWGGRARADVELAIACGALGFAIESALVQSGAFHHAAPFDGVLAPPWIVGLWAAFGLTLNHSLAFLASRPLAAVLLGLVGGPVAYGIAASRFGAIAFDGTSVFGLALVGLAWGASVPLLASLACVRAQALAVRHA